MGDGENATVTEMPDESAARRLRWEQEIKEVGWMFNAMRHGRQRDAVGLGPVSQGCRVTIPDSQPLLLYPLALLELAQKLSSEKIGRKKA
jgi:hypothetical protein